MVGNPNAGKSTLFNALTGLNVKVGNIVLMEKYTGQEVILNDEEFFIVRSDDIIAIIEK